MIIYRFDQIAENIRVTIIPSDTDLDRYVGLEHLDPESLKLRRWGNPSDVIGQKLRFWKGDIIYGKRRAYQRKLAVADFEGICSAHAFVLRAKPDVCLPEFFPFFLQSDLFHNRALEISVGSLSPTINWSALAKQEFPLPPLDEQRRIADLLWAADDAVKEILELEKSLQTLLLSQLVEHFVNIPKKFSKEWELVDLQDLCDKPIVYGIVQAYENIEDGIPYVRVVDMVNGRLSLDGMLRTTAEIDHAYRRARIEMNDIVFALRGEIGNVLMVPQELNGINISRGIARLSAIDGLENYVLWAIRSPYVKNQITKVSTGSTFKEIKIGSLRQIKIPVPIDRSLVIAITDTLNITQSTFDILANHIKVSKQLKSKYMNQLLS